MLKTGPLKRSSFLVRTLPCLPLRFLSHCIRHWWGQEELPATMLPKPLQISPHCVSATSSPYQSAPELEKTVMLIVEPLNQHKNKVQNPSNNMDAWKNKRKQINKQKPHPLLFSWIQHSRIWIIKILEININFCSLLAKKRKYSNTSLDTCWLGRWWDLPESSCQPYQLCRARWRPLPLWSSALLNLKGW